jgi:hypothetical protein
MWGMLNGARRDMGFIGQKCLKWPSSGLSESSAAATPFYGEKVYACGYPMHIAPYFPLKRLVYGHPGTTWWYLGCRKYRNRYFFKLFTPIELELVTITPPKTTISLHVGSQYILWTCGL